MSQKVFFPQKSTFIESKIKLCTLSSFTMLIFYLWHWLTLLSCPHLHHPFPVSSLSVCVFAICYSTLNYTRPRKAKRIESVTKISEMRGVLISHDKKSSPISMHLCLAVCCLECQYFQCLSWSSLVFSSPNTTITTLWKKHGVTAFNYSTHTQTSAHSFSGQKSIDTLKSHLNIY